MVPENYPTPQTKLAIVKEAWAGRKIAQIAKKYKVCRDSIYTWMQLATQACLHAFSPKKRGPKFKKLLNPEEVILSLEERVSDLENEIKRNSHNSQTIPSLKYAKLIRPDHCPHCGHPRILLNGYYPVKTQDGTFVDMPRFICKQCRKRVYL
jgi:transposase-like protein